MTRSTALASLAVVAALAAAPLAARAEAGGVVGGGGGVLSQPGRLARFAGGHGEGGLQVEYLTPAPADTGLEAWLLGGGDNAEVVYDRRR